MGVLRLNRAAVENAQFVGELRAERFSGFGSDNGGASAAICGVAVFPVPMAQTGS